MDDTTGKFLDNDMASQARETEIEFSANAKFIAKFLGGKQMAIK